MITTMLTEIERSTPVQIRDNLRSLQDSKEHLQLKLSKIAEQALKVVMTKNYAHDDRDPLPLGPHPMILSPLEQSDL